MQSPTKPREGAGRLTGRRAAVLLYSYYPGDPRPRRAAEALADEGMHVDLFCLAEKPDEPLQEVIRGVHVTRLRIRKSRDSKLSYIINYTAFLLATAFAVSRRLLKGRYDVIHAHNMPDILVFSGLLPRLFGARIILDLHDPMPELMTSIYNLQPDHPLVRLLRFLERRSLAFAHMALTPNVAFRNLFISRGCPPSKMHIIMNSPEEDIFDPNRVVQPAPASSGNNAEFRLMHHGSIVHRHGVDILIQAVALAQKEIPGLRLDIYGSKTDFLDTVLGLARELGVADRVTYHGPKTQREIAEAIIRCDLGIVPNRRSPFTELNFPTRLFEYLSMGRPVIAPNTQGIRDYFSDRELRFFEPNLPEDLARQMVWVRNNPEEVRNMVERGRAVYRSHLWSEERARLVDLVDHLTAGAAKRSTK